ncbi:MAG: tetratricopeptide repeat protein, partial [Crocinitomicaceae bacterium]
LIQKARGDLDGAEEMYKKSLAIEEKLGHLEGMASDYGNLGLVFQARGDLDGAEELYKKSLEIGNKSGFKEIIEIAERNLELLNSEREKK